MASRSIVNLNSQVDDETPTQEYRSVDEEIEALENMMQKTKIILEVYKYLWEIGLWKHTKESQQEFENFVNLCETTTKDQESRLASLKREAEELGGTEYPAMISESLLDGVE